MIRTDLLTHVQQLVAERQPFVVATVVRARQPTSVRPGDSAIVLADGTIEGFVGGVCATSSVRLHSLRVLETGEALLLRLIPGDDDAGLDAAEGEAVVERNPCLSGGSLELFLEPHLPFARLFVIGDSPIAHALQRIAQAAGLDSRRQNPGAGEMIDDAAAVVVASHGNGEEAVLANALKAGVPYVALVASEKRGEAVRAALDVPEELRAQLRTPAGLRIGARTPEEIAISILAQLVEQHHSSPSSPAARVVTGTPVEAIDPVCGMRVAVTELTPQLQIGDELVYFCCEGCRDRYARESSDPVAAS